MSHSIRMRTSQVSSCRLALYAQSGPQYTACDSCPARPPSAPHSQPPQRRPTGACQGRSPCSMEKNSSSVRMQCTLHSTAQGSVAKDSNVVRYSSPARMLSTAVSAT